MDSIKLFHQDLTSPWTKGPACLLERLVRAATVELASSSSSSSSKASSRQAKYVGDATPSTSHTASPSSSRRESQEGRSLCDTLVVSPDEQLLDESYDKYSRTFHMVLLDGTYSVFASPKGYGTLIYTIAQRTLVVMGDPLCSIADMSPFLDELRHFRRTSKPKLKLAFMGVSASFLQYANRQKRWAAFQFGRERVLNPLTNDVLNRKAGKRILSQNRQLLDPNKGNLTMRLYSPSTTGVIDAELEGRLERLYGDWCADKLTQSQQQAFITAYHLFSHRSKTAILYTVDGRGELVGLAMLRQLGANAGFHIDPCIAAADSPRGTTDLLMVTAMKILRRADIAYLSLGAEPYMALHEQGPEQAQTFGHRLAGLAYRKVTDQRYLAGKKMYNDKFHPDPELESSLYVVFPKALLPVQEALAVMKVAHIRPRDMFTG